MTNEERTKVLDALEEMNEAIFEMHGCHIKDLQDAAAIMRKEQEPVSDAEMAARLRSAWQNHTGHEPSESVLASAIDDAAALLEKAR
jgi:hypothetical protein